MVLYNIGKGGKGLQEADLKQVRRTFALAHLCVIRAGCACLLPRLCVCRTDRRSVSACVTGVTARAQYTAEFMLTRGPYAMLGYSWYGCTGSAAAHGAASPDPPRATEWDVDFGAPSDKRERIFPAGEPLGAAVQGPRIEPRLTRTRAAGEPAMACKETAEGSGIFQREWGKATVHQTTQHTPTISDRTPKEP